MVLHGPRSSFHGEGGVYFRARRPSVGPFTELPKEEQHRNSLFGQMVLKNFGGRFFSGQVIAIDRNVKTGELEYVVAYEDGDQEHLEENAVRRHAVQTRRRTLPIGSTLGNPVPMGLSCWHVGLPVVFLSAIIVFIVSMIMCDDRVSELQPSPSWTPPVVAQDTVPWALPTQDAWLLARGFQDQESPDSQLVHGPLASSSWGWMPDLPNGEDRLAPNVGASNHLHSSPHLDYVGRDTWGKEPPMIHYRDEPHVDIADFEWEFDSAGEGEKTPDGTTNIAPTLPHLAVFVGFGAILFGLMIELELCWGSSHSCAHVAPPQIPATLNGDHPAMPAALPVFPHPLLREDMLRSPIAQVHPPPSPERVPAPSIAQVGAFLSPHTPAQGHELQTPQATTSVCPLACTPLELVGSDGTVVTPCGNGLSMQSPVLRQLNFSAEADAFASPAQLAHDVVPMNGLYYVASVHDSSTVVRVVGAGHAIGTYEVQAYEPFYARNGRLTFRKDARENLLLLRTDLFRTGPFQLHAGMPPREVADMFQASVGKISSISSVSTSSSIGSCTTPRSRFIVDGPRFRHTRTLTKLKDMGYEDTERLREIINSRQGDLNGVLYELLH